MRMILSSAVMLSGFLVVLAYHPSLLIGPQQAGYHEAVSLLSQIVTGTSLVGAGVVFVVYWLRFGQWTDPDSPDGFRPHPTRHSTTCTRYLTWASLYAGFMVGCYAFIILFPQVLVNLSPAIAQFGIDVPYLDDLRRMAESGRVNPDALVPYALIITLLAWGELVAKPEREFRRRMQELALIPAEGQSLIEQFEQRCELFDPDPTIVEKVAEELGLDLVPPACFTSQGDLLPTFARCAYLHYQMRTLHSRRLKRIAKRHREELKGIGKAIDSIADELRRLRKKQLEFLSDLATEEEDLARQLPRNGELNGFSLADFQRLAKTYGEHRPYAKSYFDTLEKEIASRVTAILTRLYQVAACSVLAMGRSPKTREDLFLSLGLRIPHTLGVRMQRETLMRALLALVSTILVCSFVYYALFGTRVVESESVAATGVPLVPKSIGQVWEWTMWGCAMHLLGILGGYLMERSHERMAHLSDDDRTPDRARIADYAECFALGFALNIFLLAFAGTLDQDWESFVQMGWPWAFVPAVTGGFTGFYMQRSRTLLRPKWRYSLAQGCANTLIVILVLAWMFDPQIRQGAVSNLDTLNFALYAILTVLVVGIALGFVLQNWVYRERIGKQSDKRRGERRRVKLAGRWVTPDSARTVNIRAISESGVRLAERLMNETQTEGTLTLPNGEAHAARIVRHVKNRSSCLEFMGAEAKKTG